jgi:phage-related protein (TIGR01555 family)
VTVTRYKRQRPTSETIKEAVLGVMRHTPAVAATPAPTAKPAPAADKVPPRTAVDLEKHHAAVVEPRAPMKISSEVMARAARKTRSGASQSQGAALYNPFQAFKPPPGVLPQGAEPEMALDGAIATWANESYTNAWNFANPIGEAFSEGIGFLGYAYLSQLTQRPEYRRISERLATEMTRKWIRLTIAGEAEPESDASDEDADEADEGLGADKAPDAPLEDEEDDDADGAPAGGAVADDDEEDDEPTPEEIAQRKRNEALQKKLKAIEEDMKRLDLRGKFKTVAEFDGWMGRSHLYIDTGDSDDPDELKSDLGNGSDETSKAQFKKGSLKNIKHIEPIWCYPVNYNANDPLADDWYNPQVWFAMAKQVHVSRLLTFVGRPVPDILKPSYAFGGLSMSQMAKPYVDNWLRTRQAVTNLIESFSVSGVYTNAQSLLQGGGEEVLDRIDLFNKARSNAGAMVLDKETEEFFNISTPLGTLDHLQAQSQEQMSSVSGIPLIVLLGITPSGLNASSEGELRVFYDLVHAMQENLFRDKLKRIIDFIQLNLFGEVDPSIGFEFEPLWSLDEKGESEVKKTEAETHQIYVDMGVIGQEEVREIVIADDDSPYNGLEPDDLPEPPADQGMVQGGGAGGGGEGGSGSRDNKEVDGAADEAIEPSEIAADVWAFDDGQFDESKVKRDQDGKFSTTGGGGTPASGKSSAAKALADVAKGFVGAKFNSKKEIIGHLLEKGTTAKEIMETMGWPSVSMPAQAKSLGMKLEKYTENGKLMYKGHPMTDAEKKAAKEAAALTPEKKAAIAKSWEGPAVTEKTPEPAKLNALAEFMSGEGGTYPKFLGAVAEALQKNDTDTAANLLKYNPAFAEQLSENMKPAMKDQMKKMGLLQDKPTVPQATPEELKKAKKGTTLPISSSEPEAVTAIKEFNAKYAGKEGLSDAQLNQKVADYKATLAKVKQTESAAAEAAAKKVEENAKKAAAEKAEKEAKAQKELDEKFAADPELKTHYEAMEALFGGGDAAKAYVAQAEKKVKSAGLSKHISGADAVPIIAYSGSHYGKVNSELRRGTMTVAQYKFMKSLNSGLEKLPKYTQTTYRKASLTPEQFKAYIPGHIIEERGFTSTSKNQGTWSGDYSYTVHGKNGRDIEKLSSHPGEAEVLFKSGSRFHVKSVKGTHIELEEV